jgi:hypothetical protein
MPGPYLSSSVAVRPLSPAKDHRLGRLLSYQRPNPARAYRKKVVYFMVFLMQAFFL